MNATQLLIGLVGLFIGLLVVALIKSHVDKQKITSIHTLNAELAKLLPHHHLLAKDGTPARVIVSLNGTQKAIVVMDTPKAKYMMGEVAIFTTNQMGQLKAIVEQIKALSPN